MFPDTLLNSLPEPVLNQIKQLDAEERLELFLQYTVKAKEVWVLIGESGYVMLESTDTISLPVWLHKDTVTLWERADMQPATAQAVSLESFLTTWLPGLQNNETTLVIAPAGSDQPGMVLTANELRDSLREAGAPW
ncbi:DUF2750 domain-containing protein [Alteromonas pelagimontana]|uniref:DUF2750 domain-containing protein n=1 Tax=Alteromonas pelagimontana TaxID=1858656 RepID=A0A6M4M8N0_9ALTE|nr:DUF2750 domain-containing protein [Alteromonas pelagimontana]QJR79497.1 DUF2750 domain-containing protein [Alteromonas pelagimontana]